MAPITGKMATMEGLFSSWVCVCVWTALLVSAVVTQAEALNTQRELQPRVHPKVASGLEKDVDDPQGVYPAKTATQHHRSSSLALEGDEESSGQTADNTAGLGSGRRKRSSPGTRGMSRPELDQPTPRHRRLVIQRTHGLSPDPRASSLPPPSFPPSVPRPVAGHTARRAARLDLKSAGPAPSLTATDTQGPHPQSLLSEARAKRHTLPHKPHPQQASRRLSVMPPKVAMADTAHSRYRRDTEQPSSRGPNKVNAHAVSDRHPRQAEGGDDDDDDDDGNDDDDGEDDDDSDDDDDDGGSDGDDGGIDFAMLRKKRSGLTVGRQDSAVHQQDWQQGEVLSHSVSSADRQKRQADIVKDIISADDELDDSEDSDELDDSDDDDEDDNDTDLNMFRKKRQTDSEDESGDTDQQATGTHTTDTLPGAADSKRQEEEAYDASENNTPTDDDTDTNDSDSQKDAAAATMNDRDALKTDPGRRKRGLSGESLTEKKNRVVRQEQAADEDSDEEDEPDDPLQSALGQLLDDMVDNPAVDDMAENDLSLRRKRNVEQPNPPPLRSLRLDDMAENSILPLRRQRNFVDPPNPRLRSHRLDDMTDNTLSLRRERNVEMPNPPRLPSLRLDDMAENSILPLRRQKNFVDLPNPRLIDMAENPLLLRRERNAEQPNPPRLPSLRVEDMAENTPLLQRERNAEIPPNPRPRLRSHRSRRSSPLIREILSEMEQEEEEEMENEQNGISPESLVARFKRSTP